MCLEQRRNDAAEKIAEVIIDHGFDSDEAKDLLSHIYAGFLAEMSMTRGGTSYIFSECSNTAKLSMDESLEMSKRDSNGRQ
jgi:hypothetical protein